MNRKQEKVVRELVKQEPLFMDLVNEVVAGKMKLDAVWPAYFDFIIDLFLDDMDDDGERVVAAVDLSVGGREHGADNDAG